MPLSFPPYDHIPLRYPPLREVICQIRFPLILKIAEEIPAEFQDAIRGRFPAFGTEQRFLFAGSPDQPMRSADAEPPVHKFLDRGKVRTASLGVDFFAMSTIEYDSWESFADDLRLVSEAAMSVYEIRYSTRIGLRYINVLDTSNTGTNSFFPDVLDMLRPELTALLRVGEMKHPDIGLAHIRVEHEDSTFAFRSGIVKDEGKQGFVLDFDLYTEQELDIDVESLLARCDRYHALIYNAFRWCIVPGRLSIFEPIE